MNSRQPKPFLKWAGGKTQLLKSISSKFPYEKEDTFIYIEPFVGSGAVLFWVLNNYPNLKKAVINDVNTDLINTYKVITESVEEVIQLLKGWEKEYHSLSEKEEEKKVYYYSKRKLFNSRVSNVFIQAALFIFLNKTCFNGLYRVNKKNLFNVPIGSYKKPLICDDENLSLVSQSLKKVLILDGDFEQTISCVENQTCFYLDPPYKPLSETSSFNSYAKDIFDDKEQIRLKNFCDTLDSLNCQWILSNSDVKGNNHKDNFFDDLYEKFKIDRVLAKRSINANASKRGQLTELLITNC
ncbi:MAG: DNA adenine methylase [Candidatus Parabeggiatoa sp.]|nr:DNA adenine methylase [Candidatus Parabeggiatoa sp.]